MGCDIHIYAEVFEEGNWKPVRRRYEVLCRSIEKSIEDIESDKKLHLENILNGGLALLEEKLAKYQNRLNWIQTNRNYNFFARLSNVRNYTSSPIRDKYIFKDTQEDFEGWPSDVDDEFLPMKNDPDLHSFTVLYGNEKSNFKNLIDEYLRIDGIDTEMEQTLIRNDFKPLIDDPIKLLKSEGYNLENIKINSVMEQSLLDYGFKPMIEEPIELLKREGYEEENIRLLIAYDN